MAAAPADAAGGLTIIIITITIVIIIVIIIITYHHEAAAGGRWPGWTPVGASPQWREVAGRGFVHRSPSRSPRRSRTFKLESQ